MVRHQIIFSFVYNKDYWCTVQIRNLGTISDDFVLPVHAWEEVRVKTNEAIKE